jgi:hypothetical protein
MEMMTNVCRPSPRGLGPLLIGHVITFWIQAARVGEGVGVVLEMMTNVCRPSPRGLGPLLIGHVITFWILSSPCCVGWVWCWR